MPLGSTEMIGMRHGTWWDRIAHGDITIADAMEGRFFRLFDGVRAPAYSDSAIQALAAAMTAQPDAQTPESEVDPEENRGLQRNVGGAETHWP